MSQRSSRRRRTLVRRVSLTHDTRHDGERKRVSGDSTDGTVSVVVGGGCLGGGSFLGVLSRDSENGWWARVLPLRGG